MFRTVPLLSLIHIYGLAQAFIIGEEFIGNDTVCMVLGDNIFGGHGLKKRLKAAVDNAETGKGATVFGYYVDCLLYTSRCV